MENETIVKEIKKLLSEEYSRKDIILKLGITESKYKTLNRKYRFNSKNQEVCLYKDKIWLKQKYLELQSAQAIAKICNVKPKTITYWRKKLGIPKANMSTNAKKYDANYRYFEKIDTEEKAYWLGFIMADGCVSKTGNSYRLVFGLSGKDKEHLEKFKTSIASSHKIYEAERITKFSNNKKLSVASLIINNRDLGLDLIKQGVIANKTGEETIPNIRKDLIRHYLRGFFDGDGSISYYNNRRQASFEISCSSFSFMQSLQNVLTAICLKRFEIKEDDSGKYSVPFYRIKIMNKAYNEKIFKYLYDDSIVFLSRKKEIAQKYFSII